jgi:uncharacterized protein (TIGR02588 family)
MTQTKKPVPYTSKQTWALAAIGMLFLFASFSVLLRESLAGAQPAADIAIRVDEIRPSAQGHLVSLKIANSGTATAASLGVEGVLTRGGVDVESSDITIDYVAAGSERDAVLFFSNDPRQGELSVRAKGYIEP